MHAYYDHLGLPFDVGHEVEVELKISRAKRELFVPLNRELVSCIDIAVHLLQKLQESEESVLRQDVLHVLDQSFDVLCLVSIPVQFVPEELPELVLHRGRPEVVRGLFSRDHQLELVGMTQNNSIQMLDLLFFRYLKSVNKDFGV